MSESVAAALSESLGRPAAQELVEQAAAVSTREGRAFRDVLLTRPRSPSPWEPTASTPRSIRGTTSA